MHVYFLPCVILLIAFILHRLWFRVISVGLGLIESSDGNVTWISRDSYTYEDPLIPSLLRRPTSLSLSHTHIYEFIYIPPIGLLSVASPFLSFGSTLSLLLSIALCSLFPSLSFDVYASSPCFLSLWHPRWFSFFLLAHRPNHRFVDFDLLYNLFRWIGFRSVSPFILDF